MNLLSILSTIVSWISILLAVFFVLQTISVRYRLSSCVRLSPTITQVTAPFSEYRVLLAPTVQIDEKQLVPAFEYMRGNGLDVLELIPGDLSSRAALTFFEMVDPNPSRENIFAKGRTVLHATVVSEDVYERARVTAEELADPASYQKLAARLRRFASRSSAYAVAPLLRTGKKEACRIEQALFCAYTSPFTPVFACMQLAFLLLMIMGVVVNPLWGGLAIAVYHIQPIAATLGSGLAPFDLWRYAMLRIPIEILTFPSLVRYITAYSKDSVEIESQRRNYESLLSKGIECFFEPRRDECPLCGSRDLSPLIRVPDLLQGKPGIFTLERCGSCAHVFQNPRLSVRGLDFYYKDFYEGVGEESINYLFGFTIRLYYSRAKALEGLHQPTRWLDVGAGLGHFCAIAKSVWPGTQFDGLDMNETIEEAQRARWIDNAICGQFPRLAETLKGKYDVISMYQYLEHTREPFKELKAAEKVLCEGGYLAIEIPNPECPMSRILGKYWHPWFQPQHQHLFTQANLEKLLREAGFTVIGYDYVQPHQAVDLWWFACFLLFRLGNPVYRLPWGPRASWYRILRTWTVYSLGFWLMPLCFIIDALIAPLLQKPRRSNNYRILARKLSSS